MAFIWRMSGRVRRERSARRCVLEFGQPVAHLRAQGEVFLLLVALERLGERGGFVALAGGVQHLREVAERVALHVQRVGAFADRDGLAAEPAQIVGGRGLSAATVAIDPAPFRGVLPLPISSLKSAWPVLGNPANSKRAVTLTLKQFAYGWANVLSDDEAKQLHETFHVAAPGAPLFQAASANLNPWAEAKVNSKSSDRGPLLLISGEKDHTVPWAIVNASYKKQRRNSGVTEVARIPNRGHALTIDGGWREVADKALAFVQRFA